MRAALLIGLFASSSAGSSSAAPRYLVFGTEAWGWILVEAHSHRAEPLHFPARFRPEAVAISKNGGNVVFTAFHAPAKNVLLFRWDRNSNEPPITIGDERGYHADPTISDDGKWVYFAHNPFARGPPGQHQQKAYAQLYRVRLDGHELEALTDEIGCHFGPSVASSDRLLYVYSACSGDRVLRWFRLDGHASTDILPPGFIYNEPSISPDFGSVVVSAGGPDSVSLYEIDLRTNRLSTLLKVPQSSLPARPQYGASRREILYQADRSVWLWTRNAPKRIATFTGEP